MEENLGAPRREKPLVSVVVPAHNCADFLGATLDSLSAQTLLSFEVIIIDDGSTDGTRRIAEDHASRDPRIRIIRRETASGRPSCARNLGIKAADGEYIALLDGDDVSVPHRLEAAVDAMRRTGAKVAFADFQRLYDATGVIEQQTVLSQRQFLTLAAPYLESIGNGIFRCRPNFIEFMLGHFEALQTPTIVFAKELLAHDESAYDERLIAAEDLDLSYRLAQRTTLAFIDDVHSLYRIHANSLTRTAVEQTLLDGATVRLKYLAASKRKISHTRVRRARESIARSLNDVGYARWCADRRSGARQIYLQSWRLKPSVAAFAGFLKAYIRRDIALSVIRVVRRPKSELSRLR